LARRIGRLSEETQKILTTAAVIGRTFPLEVLEELEKSRPDAALDAIEEAERAHMVETESAGRETRYRFGHQLVRQSLVETLSLPRRRRLHARVASAMEHVFQSSIEAHVPALAHHLYQAGAAADREKTIHFLLEAARQASGAAAHEEALDHLNNAFSLLENEATARTGELHGRRAAVLRSLSRTPEAIQEYELALALFEALGDHARFVETCVPLLHILAWGVQTREMNALVDRAAQHARGAPAAPRCMVLAMQAASAAMAGETDKALDFLEEMHQIPGHELPPQVVAFAAILEVPVREFAGQIDLCEAVAKAAKPMLEQSGSVWWQAHIAHGLFEMPLYSGRPEEAERLIREAIPRAVRIGLDDAKFVSLRSLADVCIARGDLKNAERTAKEALAFGASIQAGTMFAAETSLGGVLHLLDRAGEAVPLLRKAASHGVSFFSGYPEGLLALSMTAAGMEGAAEACNAAMKFLPRPGVSRGLGAWYAVLTLTEALCLGGRREEAARLQTEAEKIASEWDSNHCGFPVRSAAGIAAACAGNWPLAEEHHRAAIARMDAVPYPTGRAIARYWYADMLAERRCPGDVEAAKILLREAIAASDAIGLALYARLAGQRLQVTQP
jgi:tetratricopeptide (TPR) repeat protein